MTLRTETERWGFTVRQLAEHGVAPPYGNALGRTDLIPGKRIIGVDTNPLGHQDLIVLTGAADPSALDTAASPPRRAQEE